MYFYVLEWDEGYPSVTPLIDRLPLNGAQQRRRSPPRRLAARLATAPRVRAKDGGAVPLQLRSLQTADPWAGRWRTRLGVLLLVLLSLRLHATAARHIRTRSSSPLVEPAIFGRAAPLERAPTAPPRLMPCARRRRRDLPLIALAETLPRRPRWGERGGEGGGEGGREGDGDGP